MARSIKIVINILCLIMVMFLPGSGLILILFIHDRSLFLNILRGNRNILPLIKDVLNESYNGYINSKRKR